MEASAETKDDPIRLLATKGDKEIAADLKARMEAAMAPLLALWEEASQMQFQGGFRFERDGFGKARFVVTLMKEF